MRRGIITMVWVSFLVQFSHGQEQQVQGTVTYIAGDVVYTSLGRMSGVQDSTRLYITDRSDTVIVLQVFAMSSRSSACHIRASRRRPEVNDVVTAMVAFRTQPEPKTARSDSTSNPTQETSGPGDGKGERSSRSESWVTMHGRVAVQYFSTLYSDDVQNMTEPGVSVTAQGRIRNSPIRFDLAGNFRGVEFGSHNPFNAALMNRSRLYRLSIEYDDTTSRIMLGRIQLPMTPLAGYIDGLAFLQTIGDLTLGTTLGFEPDFSQQSFTGDRKKIAFLARYTFRQPTSLSLEAAYARTFYHTTPDRESIDWSAVWMASQKFYFMAQSEIDLRTVLQGRVDRRPKVTSLHVNLNYRPVEMLSLGAGGTLWRPIYSLPTSSELPDTFIDRSIRVSPTMTVTVHVAGGIFLTNVYSPRWSQDHSRSEYTNSSSVVASNLFRQEISIRGLLSVTSSTFTTVRGYGGGIEKSFSGVGSIGIRYQESHYHVEGVDGGSVGQSIAFDGMISLSSNTVFWGSVERLNEVNLGNYTVRAELDWRY